MYIIICETDCQSRFDAWDRVLRAGALGWPRGMEWGGSQEKDSGLGARVHPWLIHVSVRQKPPQYYKLISLQLKFKEKKMLAPWKKSYDKPRQHIKKQRYYFATMVHLVKAMVCPVVMYGCESWTIKKAEHQRIAFELWYWRILLRVLRTARRSN